MVAGSAPAMAAINYLVFTYALNAGTTGAGWTGPSVSVTSRVQDTCPANGAKIYYGVSQSAYLNGTNQTTSGSVCVMGVPSTVKLLPTGNLGVGPTELTLSLSDASATSLVSYGQGSTQTGQFVTTHAQLHAILLPDAKVIMIGVYGNYWFGGGSWVGSGTLVTSFMANNSSWANANSTVGALAYSATGDPMFHGTSVSIGGYNSYGCCFPVTYVMGY